MDILIIFGAKYLIALPICALLFALYYLKGRKRMYLLYLSCLALPLAFSMGALAGSLYYNTRPFVVGGFTPLVEHAANNGFPSDHMLLAATVATLIFFVNVRLGSIVWVFVLLIGLSRVFAGVHHMLDIVASAVIAVVSVFVAHLILFWFRKRNKKR